MAVEDATEEAAVGDVVIEDVGDLELPSTGWRQPIDDIEGIGPEEVDTDRDEVALGDGGLLLETDDVARGIELGDTEPLRVRDAVEQRAGAPRAGLELGCRFGQRRAAEDVVAEHAAERLVTDEAMPSAPPW